MLIGFGMEKQTTRKKGKAEKNKIVEIESSQNNESCERTRKLLLRLKAAMTRIKGIVRVAAKLCGMSKGDQRRKKAWC